MIINKNYYASLQELKAGRAEDFGIVENVHVQFRIGIVAFVWRNREILTINTTGTQGFVYPWQFSQVLRSKYAKHLETAPHTGWYTTKWRNLNKHNSKDIKDWLQTDPSSAYPFSVRPTSVLINDILATL